MPPKARITKEDIIKTTVNLVRENGTDCINARSIAAALNCSTQPIFSNFESMEDLERAVILSAYDQYLNFIKFEVESNKYPQYKSFGMAYVRFAKEEKELFKLLFMRDRTDEEPFFSSDFEESVEIIMNTNGISREKATLLHLEMWTCVHGIGTMLATSFMQLEWDIISDILSDIYHGISAKYVSEGNKNECN